MTEITYKCAVKDDRDLDDFLETKLSVLNPNTAKQRYRMQPVGG